MGVLRTQSEVFFAENEVPVLGPPAPGEAAAAGAIDLLIVDMDKFSQKLFDASGDGDGIFEAGENIVAVGGSKVNACDDVICGRCGRNIGFIFADPASTSVDGISVYFAPSETTATGIATAGRALALDTKENKWTSY